MYNYNNKEFLENEGKEVIVGNNTKTGYPGHVLGCDYSAIDQEGDCFIYFGSGRFHPSGFLTEKPFFVVDSEKKELVDISPEVKKNIIKKELSLEKARGLKHFIVYVSTKTGQMNIEKASEVKKKLEAKNKEALIVSADMLTPSKLLGIKYDVIINTACPRLRDDSSQFKKIILNSMDVDKL